MATPFKTIYKRFLNQINDADFLEADEEVIKELLFEFLKNSLVEFEYRCDKSLDFIKPCSGSTIFSVVDNKCVFNDFLSEHLEFNIYCNVTGKQYFQDIDYKLNFVKTGDLLDFIEIIFLNEDIYYDISVEYDYEGEFLENLTNTEEYIVVLGMLIHWVNPKINVEENLSNVLTDKDYRQLSPANMLHRLTNYRNTLRNDLEMYIQRYNFKNFGGF